MEVPFWALPLALMWIPALVALSLRGAFREGCSDAGFHVGRFRYWAVAYCVPLIAATLTYAGAWALRQVHIHPYLKQQSMFGTWPFKIHWWNSAAGTAGLLGQRFAVVATWGIASGFVGALGEEIGWRGYLLPKLIEARTRFPILISGIIWAAWHVPWVLLTFEHHSVETAALYSLLCIVVGVFISWLRLASGSVFVAAMAHASYNAFFQNFFDYSFDGPNKWFWAGEVGLLASVFFAGVAVTLYRTNRLATAAGGEMNSDICALAPVSR